MASGSGARVAALRGSIDGMPPSRSDDAQRRHAPLLSEMNQVRQAGRGGPAYGLRLRGPAAGSPLRGLGQRWTPMVGLGGTARKGACPRLLPPSYPHERTFMRTPVRSAWGTVRTVFGRAQDRVVRSGPSDGPRRVRVPRTDRRR